ncbi:3-phosphoshikimate 1-carboxyvinyltransferase [Halobacillus amylolyticus]|uniref:3-phosphoshikimate 1-carboxyvinyltransferase n=1 Tax=Halobacillus amylolyticus TaxID=2932259 RepID=A0ABY4HHF9_9BACI|nr:3-phosphoshikimate 1-carboxyvinyltransferase [Halobacillus amylolyticus]UOR12875.1 3-phosphoshikimate 1-carboxyvinyltransferase [Halobacillus amylolyticus]
MSNTDMKARSPWSTLNEVQTVTISPVEKQMNSDIRIPGSKSFTNRALIMAALAKGTSTLSGILKSDDSYWCIDVLNKLGVRTEVDGDVVTVSGCNSVWPTHQADLYIGAAGTIARFLPGALAVSKEGNWVLEASNRMSERPVQPLIKALTDLGADIKYLSNEGYYPIQIKGGGLEGGLVSISGKISSQFISGLLMASPYAKKEVTVSIPDYIVQHDYVRITLNLMEKFGVNVHYSDDLTQMVVPKSEYLGRDIQLEADASTASYFLALAAIMNGRIRINNLSVQTDQPDIKMIDVYEKMGCKIVRGLDYIELTGAPTLQGGFEISMKEMSDQTLTLASIAPFASGPITLKDVEHIRHHESDRISAICTELKKLGIEVTEYKDGLTVFPGNPLAATLDSYDDHRVAMSLALIGAKVPGVQINNPGCVSKTCPSYFELLNQLGVQVEYTK